MISIRKATDNDNQILLNLERICPQGTNLVLQFDRSPDFYLRSKVYDNYSVFVAEEEGRIVGTAASAVKKFNLNGKKVTGLYIYDVRVHPDYRGKGIAKQLAQHAMNQNTQAEVAYAIIQEDNYPSKAVFSKLGFKCIRDILLLNLLPHEGKESPQSRIRTMTKRDIPPVVTLINNHNQNRDLFFPLSPTDFADKTKRLPGYGMERIQVAEVDGRIVACAGLWDYSQILRITALRVSAKLKTLTYFLRFVNLFRKTMRLPMVGKPLKLMYVRDFAHNGGKYEVEELMEHCLHMAYDYGCHFVSFALDPEDPMIIMLERHKPIRVTYHVYAKSLTSTTLSIPTAIHVDVADL